MQFLACILSTLEEMTPEIKSNEISIVVHDEHMHYTHYYNTLVLCSCAFPIIYFIIIFIKRALHPMDFNNQR